MSNRQHFRGEINWRVYDVMATPGQEAGIMFARAMAEGNGRACYNEKTNTLESGVTHVTWPVQRRA